MTVAENRSPLSFGDEITAERRKSEFALATITAAGGTQSVLSLVVPREWTRISQQARLPGQRHGWEELACFVASNQASLHVFQCVQRHEVDLRDWLEYQAGLLAITLAAEQTGDTEFGQMVHAFGTTAEGERVRIAVVADGPAIFLLTGRAAKSEPPSTDSVLGLAAASFLFQKHSGRKTRETLKSYSDARLAFSLLYPESWTVTGRLDADGRSVADFRILGGSDLLGYIRVAGPTSSPGSQRELREVFEATLQELKSSGVAVERLDPIPPGRHGGERERWLGTCRLPTGTGQVALLFRKAAAGWITAVMLSPGSQSNAVAWMRAKRFYEILTATLTGPPTTKRS